MKKLVLILVTIVTLGMVFYISFKSREGGQAEIAVLALTYVAILWYAYETHRMADISSRHMRIGARPIVVISQLPYLKNIGKSPAIDINVEDVSKNTAEGIYLFKFGVINILECEIEKGRGIKIEVYKEEKLIAASGNSEQARMNYLKDCTLIVEYRDVEGGKWQSVCEIDSFGKGSFKKVQELK